MISSSALLFPLSAYRSLLLPVFLGVLVGCTAKPSFAESPPTDRTDSTELTVIFVEDEVLLPPYVVVQSDSVVSINGRVVGRIYPATPTPPGTAMDSLYTATFRVFRSIHDAGLGLVAATDSAASFLSTSSLVDSVAVLGAGVLSTYSTDLPQGLSIELDLASSLREDAAIPASDVLDGIYEAAETIVSIPGLYLMGQSSGTSIPAGHPYYDEALSELREAIFADEASLEHWAGHYLTPAMARSAHDRLSGFTLPVPSR